MFEVILQVLAATVLLVLLGGVSQMLPIGVGSAKRYTQNKKNSKLFGNKPQSVSDLAKTPAVTEQFDALMPNQVSTLETDRSFSWIVSKPISYYNPNAYFGREILTQLVVAIGLVAVVHLLDFETSKALALTAVMASVASVATYGQLANWWGLNIKYYAGAALTLIVSWFAAVFAVMAIW